MGSLLPSQPEKRLVIREEIWKQIEGGRKGGKGGRYAHLIKTLNDSYSYSHMSCCHISYGSTHTYTHTYTYTDTYTYINIKKKNTIMRVN